MTHTDIKRETYKEQTLTQVVYHMKNGWPEVVNDTLKPFWIRRNEMSLNQECLMWGIRIVIPTKLRDSILQDLHSGHLGVVKMKSIARNYCWWPGLDKDIETLTKTCHGCQATAKMPQRATLHPWEWPTEPWTRIHVDFAGPFLNRMFLVMVDAHSKWPEVIIMNSTTTQATIEAMRAVFARNGLPSILVSDNGPQYTSEEFAEFMRINGILHKRSPPYHPATNGQAERFVQTFKHALIAMKEEPGSLTTKLNQFLLQYRNATHPTTNQTPAVMFLGRQLRTRLDLIKPDCRLAVQERQMKQRAPTNVPTRCLEVGDSVYARNYRGDKWFPGIITSKTGTLTYEVAGEEGGVQRRHVDQIQSQGGILRSDEADDAIEPTPDEALPEERRQRRKPLYLKDYVTQ